MIFLGKYREGAREKYWGLAPKLDSTIIENNVLSDKVKKRIWLHAVSVGEMNLLRPIIRQWSDRSPHYEFVISTTSKTGMELGRKLFSDKIVFYCPLDFSWAVSDALDRIKPDLLVLAELELWPNLILATNKRSIKTAIVNGRISERSFHRYHRIRPVIRYFLNKIDLLAAQDQTATGYFKLLGAEEVITTGAIKFDGVETDRANPRTVALAKLAGIESDEIVFLAGSTQDPEEEMALNVYQELKPNFPLLRLVIVPRHPERFESVAAMLDRSSIAWTRRSHLSEQMTAKAESVLLVDTIGELGAWWGTAAIAFVGGSMGTRGGQNMLEPAAYGAAVCFGPNTKNFHDISTAMLKNESAVVVTNQVEMTAFVRRSLEEPSWAKHLGDNAQALVIQQAGATHKTIDLLEQLLVSTITNT